MKHHARCAALVVYMFAFLSLFSFAQTATVSTQVSLAKTFSNSLPIAIAAIGSTPTKLIVDANTEISIGQSIPANVTLEQRNGAKITLSGIGSLACIGRCINGDENAFISISSYPAYLWLNTMAVNTKTHTINAMAHGFQTGQQIRFTLYKWTLTNAVIGGLMDNGVYYVIKVDANNFKLASSYTNAKAGIAIDLISTGTGSFYFNPTPLAFTGTDYPAQISSTVIDTGDKSEAKHVNLIVRALGSSVADILAEPQIIDDNIFLGDNKTLILRSGTHQNTFSGGSSGYNFFPYVVPILIGSNSKVIGEPSAVLMESSVNYHTAIMGIKGSHSKISALRIAGQGALFDGVQSGVSVFGGTDNEISDIYCDNLNSYVLAVVPVESTDQPSYVRVIRNTVKNTLTQVLFLGGGSNVDFLWNTIDFKDYNPKTATFSPVDLEPNNEYGVISHFRFEHNTIDARGNHGRSIIQKMVAGNSGDTPGFTDLSFRFNTLLINDNSGLQYQTGYSGFQLYGMDGFQISDNTIEGLQGPGGCAIDVEQSQRGRIFNNTMSNGNMNICLVGTTETEVFNNKAAPIPASGAVQTTGITEATPSYYPLDSVSGTTARLYYPITGNPIPFQGKLYNHFKGSTVYINDRPYTVNSIKAGSNFAGDTHDNITMSATITVVPTVQLRVASGNIDAATNTITAMNHGYNNCAVVTYVPGARIVGGIRGYSQHYIIRVDTDHFKLASSCADAQAGIAENISGLGSGTQTFLLTMVMYSSSNNIHDNSNQPVTLGTHSTSTEKSN